jgi:MFS family permease
LFFFWLQYYFDSQLQLGRDTSRLYTTIPMLAMALGMFVGGWTADAVGRRTGSHQARARVAMFGMTGGAVFLGLGLIVEEPQWIVFWFSCAMASVGMSEGPFWVTAIELGGARGGMSAAIFNTGGNIGGMLAPVVTPWLSNYLGWKGAMPVAGAFCLIGAALWWWVRPVQPREPSVVY